MKLKEIDKLLFDIRLRLDYQKYMTPINFTTENNKFLELYNAGKVYNPQYKYRKIIIDEGCKDQIKRCIAELKDLNPKAGIDSVLYEAALSLEKEIDMYCLIGDYCFTECCNIIYGLPKSGLIDSAQSILNTTSSDKKDIDYYSSECLSRVFKHRLSEYGLKWKIVLSPSMASRVSVEPEQKTIYINSERTFSQSDIIRLQVHEIDTHVLRCENGLKRGYNIFLTGTAGSLTHEEGLALYNEQKNGVQDSSILRLYAARFIACHQIDKSFYDIFDLLIQYGCTQEQSMYVVSRIKRGISDTSKPGGFIKDFVYFQGYNEIKDFLKNNPSLYAYLYYGSISINTIKLLFDYIKLEVDNGSIILPHPLILDI